MGKAKKWIAGIVTVALIAAGAYKGADYLRTKNQPEAVVVDVSELLVEDYYDYDFDDGALQGTITTNVIQNIKIDKDVIVGSLPVSVGDKVKKGDLLMTIDTTVPQMELGLQDLQLQKYRADLEKAQNRLYSLQHGGPIEEETSGSDGTDDTGAATEETYSYDDPVIIGAAGLFGHVPFLASAFPSVLAAELLSDGEGQNPAGTADGDLDPGQDEIIVPDQEESGDELNPEDSGIIDEIITEDEEELIVDDDDTVPSGEIIDDIIDDDIIPEPDLDPEPEPEQHQGTDFYRVLDYDSVPYEGDGSFEFPYVFFVSSEDDGVTVKGSFKNRMLGYNADGTELLHEGGYWYVLEFHLDDEVLDFDDRTLSLIGYYLINGGEDIDEPVDPEEEFFMSLEDADQYEDESEDEYEDEYYDEPYDEESDSEASMTRDEAIKLKEQEIQQLEYNIKNGEVELSRLQKKCETTEIYARIDGTVSYTGNPDTGTGGMESFLKVKSEEGYYVKGSVSEMMLDKIDKGTIVTCTTDFGETFDAEVIEVSPYPEDSSGDSFYYSGNPNASSYSFTASIADQDLDISEETYLMSVTLPSEEGSENRGITINKAFVRSENGQSYVMKDDGGVLKKQYVQVGEVDSYGYSIRITGGLRRSDKLAFPYSENAVDGTKTVDGTLDQLYGYYDTLF